MSRIIKLRAWDNELKMMVYSKEQTGHIEYDTNPVDAINTMLNYDDYGLEYMQYTGLNDKNGKEIYEGDIIHTEINDITAVIRFGIFDTKYGNINGFYAQLLNTGVVTPLTPKTIDCPTEVIGNIYQSPELLER